jgi:hypothetical protein
VDRVPILKPFYANIVHKTLQTVKSLSSSVKQKYLDRLKVHSSGVIHDFCDALIEAKEEAIAEEKESASALTDVNLSLVILNLFFG